MWGCIQRLLLKTLLSQSFSDGPGEDEAALHQLHSLLSRRPLRPSAWFPLPFRLDRLQVRLLMSYCVIECKTSSTITATSTTATSTTKTLDNEVAVTNASFTSVRWFWGWKRFSLDEVGILLILHNFSQSLLKLLIKYPNKSYYRHSSQIDCAFFEAGETVQVHGGVGPDGKTHQLSQRLPTIQHDSHALASPPLERLSLLCLLHVESKVQHVIAGGRLECDKNSLYHADHALYLPRHYGPE